MRACVLVLLIRAADTAANYRRLHLLVILRFDPHKQVSSSSSGRAGSAASAQGLAISFEYCITTRVPRLPFLFPARHLQTHDEASSRVRTDAYPSVPQNPQNHGQLLSYFRESSIFLGGCGRACQCGCGRACRGGSAPCTRAIAAPGARGPCNWKASGRHDGRGGMEERQLPMNRRKGYKATGEH
jgi:hypothetical protein